VRQAFPGSLWPLLTETHLLCHTCSCFLPRNTEGGNAWTGSAGASGRRPRRPRSRRRRRRTGSRRWCVRRTHTLPLSYAP
jgi:hypothetical protein